VPAVLLPAFSGILGSFLPYLTRFCVLPLRSGWVFSIVSSFLDFLYIYAFSGFSHWMPVWIALYMPPGIFSGIILCCLPAWVTLGSHYTLGFLHHGSLPAACTGQTCPAAAAACRPYSACHSLWNNACHAPRLAAGILGFWVGAYAMPTPGAWVPTYLMDMDSPACYSYPLLWVGFMDNACHLGAWVDYGSHLGLPVLDCTWVVSFLLDLPVHACCLRICLCADYILLLPAPQSKTLILAAATHGWFRLLDNNLYLWTYIPLGSYI